MMQSRYKPMRVLQVVTSMNRGGLETFIMNVYRQVDRNRFQFDFLTHRKEEGAYDNEIIELGGVIYHVPRVNPINPLYWRELDCFFDSHSYDVVHSHINCMSAPILWCARRHGVTGRIAHAHNSSQDEDIKYPIKNVSKRFIKDVATTLLACSSSAGEWMFGTKNFEVVRNGIDTDRYRFNTLSRARIRSELGISDDALCVGHVGRFESVKNQARIIRIFSELVSSRTDSHLLLVGDGPQRKECMAIVNELELNNRVSFCGVREDIPELMSAMDVFVMPSLYEGLPLVLVEAQASGLPCLVSSAISNECDLIPGAVSHLALDETDGLWVQFIEELSLNRGDRETSSGLVRQAGFDSRDVAERLAALYQSF